MTSQDTRVGLPATLILLAGILLLSRGTAAQGPLDFLASAGTASRGSKGVAPSIVDGFNPSDLPCITSPAEYIKAFKNREVRCTEGLLVRLGGVAAGQVGTSWYTAVANGQLPPTPWVEAEKRLREGFLFKFANFLGAGDQPQKYLAIGNPVAPRGSITTIPNGLAFLEQVGYQLSDADITGLGLLMVVRDPKTLEKGKFKKGYYGKLLLNGTTMQIRNAKDVPKKNTKWDGTVQRWPKAFVPTWPVVLNYLSGYVKSSLNTTLAAADVNATAKVLSSKTFQELTGCPALCVFEDLAFPDAVGGKFLPPANTPVRLENYAADGSCNLTDGVYPPGTVTAALVEDLFSAATPKPLVPRFRRLQPDAADPFARTCKDATFIRYRNNITRALCPGFTDLSGNLNAKGLLTRFLEFWNEPGATADTRALLVKVTLNLGCMGTFNYLFSGNGLTYTGTGGFFAPLGQERILEQLTPLKPFNPVAKGTQGLPPACPNPSGDCWNGFPYVGASCIDTAFGTTNEGLLCDSKVGLGAAFVPICFNGNTPQTDASKYPNNDPTYACWPTTGKLCSSGSVCCANHCGTFDAASRNFKVAYDQACTTNPALDGCIKNGGNCRLCRYASDAPSALPQCPACVCASNGKNGTECTASGYA